MCTKRNRYDHHAVLKRIWIIEAWALAKTEVAVLETLKYEANASVKNSIRQIYHSQ